MKMSIRIYNKFLDFQGEIDTYQSLQFGRSYHSIATFELHVNRYMHEAEKLEKGNLIALNKQSNKVAIIMSKEIALDQNGKETENFKLTGYTLDGLMTRRLTEPPSNDSHDRVKGNAETVMKHYVSKHFVHPDDPDRIFPHMEIATDRKRGNYFEWESRFKIVADELENISVKSGLGWGIFADFKTKKLIFDVIEARDLTQDNPFGNHPVFFSPEFETIKSQGFINSDNDLKTVGYVGGQGEGAERKVIKLGNKTGWDRIETFIDARDVGEGEEDEKLTPEQIEQQLTERGQSKMSEMGTIYTLEAEILTPTQESPFQYEKDFDLGDKVDVVNKSWGLKMTAPITEFMEIHEPGGFRLEGTFGRSRPTLISKIKNKFDELDGVEKQELPAQIAVETKQYTDHKVTKEEQERIKQAQENLQTSKQYTETHTSEYTYNKVTIDNKDEVVFSDGKTFAQIRANEAQSAAEAVAVAEANLAETQAKTYADGKVSAEEARAIADAEAKLAEAKADALTKANAAESAAKTHTENYSEKKRIESLTAPPDTEALWIDTSVTPNIIKRYDGVEWTKLSPTEASEIGAETPTGAQSKANQAESNAKGHADTVAGQAEANAKAYAVAKTIYDAKMTEIAGDLADKAGLAYVEGQLVSKANKGDVYTISEVDNRLLNYVGVTKYQTDMNGIVTDLNSYGTRIGQNETAIGLKANQTEVDTLKGTVRDNSAQLNIQAGQIEQKVDATYVQGAIGDIDAGRRNYASLEMWKNNVENWQTYGNAYILRRKLEPNTVYIVHSNVPEPINGTTLYFNGSSTGSNGIWAGRPRAINSGETGEMYIAMLLNREFTDDIINGKYYVMWQKGNKATDWTPAPEDTQAQIDDNALIIEQHDTSITQLSNQITSKVETSVVNAIEGRVKANETTLTQYDTRINAKAESSTVDSLGVRMNTAEADIDGLNSTITLKADATVVGALENRVSSAELTIDGMESTISAKADRIELDGFVTATDLAVDGNLTFGGHLDGATGTFKGSIETPVLNINNPNLEQEGGVSMQLQTGLWQADVNKPFKETGYIEFNTLNDALEILAYDTAGNLRDLAGFTVRAAYTKFSGTVGFTEASGAQFDKYGNIGAPPSASETSSWNVLDYQGNPIFKAKWGADPLKEGIQILGKDFKIYNGSINIYGDNRARIAVGNDRTYIQAPGEVWNTQIASSTTVNSIAKSFNIVSSLELKTDIKPISFSALDLINASDLREYKLKQDLESDGVAKTKYGFIIGGDYRTPFEVIGDNGITIDAYSHNSINSKAIQELSVITTDHDERINFLEME
ncbi:hypothetical protein MST22_15450, partial [Virgibacillus halodenitrificans]|uniref:Gp37-like protein n=1 Tax=Virgibacillus halodenitrificans TaxID=1482 RepID=UPI001FB255F9